MTPFFGAIGHSAPKRSPIDEDQPCRYGYSPAIPPEKDLRRF
ncbi:hypothetical protein [Laspinema olomoucense]|nr:hypothetical protein [Laspinema sp. D3d]